MAAAMARPWPVLPEVGSTSVPPGFSRPARAAASIIRRPIRSLTLPPGFSISSLARMVGRTPWVTRRRRTRGVSPVASRNESMTSMCASPFDVRRATAPDGSILPDRRAARRGPALRRLQHQPVDGVAVAEIQPAIRSGLHRQQALAVDVHDGLAGHTQAVLGEGHPPDLARVVGAEEQPPQAGVSKP